MISKARVVQLHRWAALCTGVFLAVMGITGAGLVYKDALEDWAHPERLVSAAPPRYEAVLSTARAIVPDARRYVIAISAWDHAARVDADGETRERLRMDPRDGQLLSRGDDGLDFVERLHTHFLGGDAGEIAVGILGMILIAIAITGLVQGWPRRWRQALKVRWSAPSPWLAYDLHRIAGLLLAALLLVQAATGIAMVFSGPVSRFVNRVAMWRTPDDPPAAPTTSTTGRISLDTVVDAAERTSPGARATRITVPRGDAPITVRLHAPSDRHPAGLGTVLVDPRDGAIIATKPLDALGPGRRMFDWIYPLHTGSLFGMPQRVAQAVVGLALPLLLASGLIVWAGRRKSRRAGARP